MTRVRPDNIREQKSIDWKITRIMSDLTWYSFVFENSALNATYREGIDIKHEILFSGLIFANNYINKISINCTTELE